MQKANKLTLVGIGYRPLNARAQVIVKSAKVLLTSSRLLDVFKRYNEYEAVKNRIKVISSVPETIVYVKKWFSHSALRNPRPELGSKAPHSALDSLVLLASGDPFFFGIGRRMVEEFGNERIEIIPDLSSMQEAFARINAPWDDAFCISVHGGPDIAKRRALPYEVGDIPQLVERYGKLAVLTDRENNPNVIAQVLKSAIRNPQSEIVLRVCERLGYPDERVWTGTVGVAAGMTFADPNVVIILKTGDRSQESEVRGKTTEAIFGLREEELAHRDGMITKDEVRAVSIHKLRLPARGLLWDIGAGSGSVAIEAARIAPGLTVIAVERDEEQVARIRSNTMKLDVRNLQIVSGPAPEALADLPAPDRVFIGGSGGNLGDIVKLVKEKMSTGIMVINAVTLETLNDSLTSLERNGFSVEVSEVSVSRSKIVGGKRLMNALNPVFIVTGRKG